VVLGAKGVERIIALKLTPEELAALQKSGADVAASIAELGVAV
jgi:malate/lactate dehydrogenase